MCVYTSQGETDLLDDGMLTGDVLSLRLQLLQPLELRLALQLHLLDVCLDGHASRGAARAHWTGHRSGAHCTWRVTSTCWPLLGMALVVTRNGGVWLLLFLKH